MIKINIHSDFEDTDELVSFLDALSSQIQAGFTSGLLKDIGWSIEEVQLKDECKNKDSNGNACYDCESATGYRCGSTPEA